MVTVFVAALLPLLHVNVREPKLLEVVEPDGEEKPPVQTLLLDPVAANVTVMPLLIENPHATDCIPAALTGTE